MSMYATTILLSAFLLFQVQPLLAKYILPWFGGTPAVWSTCMLFFQTMLLLGYSYAYGLAKIRSSRLQAAIHLCVLLATLLLLPIMPAESWKPDILQQSQWSPPTWQILALLAFCVGGPYFVLSSTAPLLQSWFSIRFPGHSPFRLYAVSNVGALLALLTYPFAFEPFLRSRTQVYAWSAMYAVFVLTCAYCGIRLLTRTVNPAAAGEREPDSPPVASASAVPPGNHDLLYWIMLPACASIMLLATTNSMCQDVASIPFLWVVPLGLYLLSFIICFDREQWYHRNLFSVLLILAIPLALAVVYADWIRSIQWQILALSGSMFVFCMCSHGELVRLKPCASQLTTFYLMISLGGALGGVFVTLVAPVIFKQYDEYIVGLAATCLMQLTLIRRSRIQAETGRRQGHRGAVLVAVATTLLLVTLSTLSTYSSAADRGVIARGRNFYGALRVERGTRPDNGPEYVSLTHGTTVHGFQLERDDLRADPTAYYVQESGIGIALRHHPGQEKGPLQIGVVGLGTGTVATYGRSGDRMMFYEINPLVLQYADEYFTFLEDARQRQVDVQLLLGDARIVMEAQLRDGQRPTFDILAVDAFTSDSIPVHLLTRECSEIYWKMLKDDGILAVHISNRNVDLQPVVRKTAELAGREACRIGYDPIPSDVHATASVWILVTRNSEFLLNADVSAAITPWAPTDRAPLLWTDDFNNLFSILK